MAEVNGIVTNVHWFADRVSMEVEFGPDSRTVSTMSMDMFLKTLGGAILVNGKLHPESVGGMWVKFESNEDGTVTPVSGYVRPVSLYEFLREQNVNIDSESDDSELDSVEGVAV